jgi:hypothetical protein
MIQRIISTGAMRSFLPLASAGELRGKSVLKLRKPASQSPTTRMPFAGSASFCVLMNFDVS